MYLYQDIHLSWYAWCPFCNEWDMEETERLIKLWEEEHRAVCH